MPAQVTLKALGLVTSPNKLAIPEGSCSIASNVVLRRDGVVEQRRGFKLYGTETATLIKQLFTYKDRILRHFGSTLQFDTEVLNTSGQSVFNTFAGSYSETEPGLRIKSIESNGNFYFTTSDGIKKISAATADQFSTAPGYITDAGGIKAINGSARIDLELGNSSGFLPEDSAVAYRFVWGKRDANNNLILGTPSERVILYNSLLNFLIPDLGRVLGALDEIRTTSTTAFIGEGGAVVSASAGAPCTITTSTHTLRVGDRVFIDGTGVVTLDGLTHEVTAVNASFTTFTVAASGGAGSATGSWYFSYAENYGLESTASSTDFKNNLISLATKLDADILYANEQATAPLDFVSSEVASGVGTLTFVGDPRNYIEVGDSIFIAGLTGTPSGINGRQTITSTTATTVTFNTDATAFGVTAADANSYITSYNYRNALENIVFENVTYDLNNTTINNPATNLQLNILQEGLAGIIARLKVEPTTVISSANQTTYITPLDVTTSCNVILTVNIPEDVTDDDFLQVYRSDISQALGSTILADLTPNDEMQLVYEAFPTAAELVAGQMIILDEVSDEFAGANLYTNPSTGEGILQANDVPPLAKDINRFKNVVFYANTQTRQRLNFNLLGITNFKAGEITNITAANPAVITSNDHGLAINDIVYLNGTGIATLDTKIGKVTAVTTNTFTVQLNGGMGSTVGYWTNAMIAIVDSSSTQQYYFIKEQAEVTNVATVADVADSLNGDYFTINSGKDETEYYVWYKTSGGPVSDPAPAGKTGIRVNITTGDSANIVAAKTRDTLTQFAQDFSISGTTNNVIITAVTKGVTTDATAATSGFTISITQQGRGEDDAFNEVLLSTLVSPAQAVDASARSLQNVVNKNASSNVYVYYLSGLADVPGKMLIEGRELSSNQFYIIANNETVGESFDPPISPSHFISNISIANPTVITTTAAHGLVSNDQAVIAFSNSTPLIDGLQTVTNLTATTFSIPVNVTASFTTNSTGVLINGEAAVVSDNEEKINRVYFSKLNQPEAVPLVNYFDVGSQEKEILRIFPLRDSLFVFKKDGLFRISGETAPFNLALFDSTCKLIAPDSISALNNQIYGWTDEGIEAVSEAGVDTASRDIDDLILRLASSSYTNFRSVTWGIGYDSDQAYIVYTNAEQSDSVAMIGFRYNLLTNRWSTIDKTTTCGVLKDADDKLYMGAGDLSFIEQERKTFDRTDYADREWVKSINVNSFFEDGERIKLSSISDISEGDVMVQEQYVTVVNFNSLLAKLDLDAAVAAVPIVSISTGSTPTITVKNLNFAPADVDTGTETITITAHGFINGQKVRFVSSGTLPAGLTANTDVFIVGATANTFQVSATLGGAPINLTSIGTGTHTVFRFHNLSAGDFVTISGSDCDPNLDGSYSVVSTPTGYTFTITPGFTITTGGTMGTARYNYSLSQEMVGGDDIRTKIVALAAKLDTDPGTQLVNYSTLIDAIGPLSILSISAANPAVITTTVPHGLTDGRFVSISGSNSTPSVDGSYVIALLSPTTFSIPVSVEIAGTAAGTVTTVTSDPRDLQACYNAIVENLNIDPGVIFNNYNQITATTLIESLITSVNAFTSEVTLSPGISYLVGNVTVYNAIESIIEYTPQTMGDPLGWKHMTNFTMMFDSKAFTEATVSFASDLLPEFIDVTFRGDGNGIFGYTGQFGDSFFGGGSHGAPFRTYFPRQVMRCRYFLVRFRHKIARESYALLGITSDGSISQSNRAYR